MTRVRRQHVVADDLGAHLGAPFLDARQSKKDALPVGLEETVALVPFGALCLLKVGDHAAPVVLRRRVRHGSKATDEGVQSNLEGV